MGGGLDRARKRWSLEAARKELSLEAARRALRESESRLGEKEVESRDGEKDSENVEFLKRRGGRSLAATRKELSFKALKKGGVSRELEKDEVSSIHCSHASVHCCK